MAKGKRNNSPAQGAAKLQLQSNEELLKKLRDGSITEDELAELGNRFEACLEMLAHPQHHYKKDVEAFIGKKTADPKPATGEESQNIVHVNQN